MVRGEIWEYFNSSGIESEAALQDVQMVLGKHLSRTTARQCPWWVRSTASCQKQQISRMWIHREISHHHHWLKMRPHLDQTEEWHTLSGCREFNGTNIEGSPSGNEKMQSTHEGAAVEVDFKCKWKGDEWSVISEIYNSFSGWTQTDGLFSTLFGFSARSDSDELSQSENASRVADRCMSFW